MVFDKSQTLLIQYPAAKAGEYTVPDTVISIGNYAFDGCSGLTNVTIPDGVTSIGERAFNYCNSLTNITIPDNVTFIGDYAFVYCTDLISATIGNGVTSIGNSTFHHCYSLASVNIGSGVTSIDNSAFGSCTSLTAITVDAGNPAYSSIDGVVFDKSQTLLIQYPKAKLGEYTVPDSVTSIDDYAFYNCYNLTGIAFGSGITSIGSYAFKYSASLTSVIIGSSVTFIGNSAFADCSSLTGVYFKGDAPDLGSNVFTRVEGIVYYIPWTTGWGATYGGLPTAEWPASPADVDLNYEVDIYEFSMLAGQWGQAGCQELNDWCGWTDFDQSGSVDPNDLTMLADDWLFGIVP